jgi:hypothetical protein
MSEYQVVAVTGILPVTRAEEPEGHCLQKKKTGIVLVPLPLEGAAPFCIQTSNNCHQPDKDSRGRWPERVVVASRFDAHDSARATPCLMKSGPTQDPQSCPSIVTTCN